MSTLTKSVNKKKFLYLLRLRLLAPHKGLKIHFILISLQGFQMVNPSLQLVFVEEMI
jgi:predicted signal transduction protein with EAL and GGDEF domain